MLRFDTKKKLPSCPYFMSNLVAYEIGLGMTVGIMHFFDAAQPALLYLVPMCIGGSMLCAVSRGELKELLNFSIAKEDGAAKKAD